MRKLAFFLLPAFLYALGSSMLVQAAHAADGICGFPELVRTETTWQPTPAELQTATEMAAAMSISELAGASFVVAYQGSNRPLSTAQKASNLDKLGAKQVKNAVAENNFAGTILFSANANTGASAYQEVSKFDFRHPWQFTSIDQEGGSVIRLSGDIAPPLSAATIGKTKNPQYAKTNALLSGNQLRAAGIDVVFAPVADVRTSKTEATLAARTLSSNPALVSKLVVAQIRGYAQSGVMPGVKHFPGLGGISADTHFAAGVYKGDVATLCRTHIQPFHAAIASGAPMVMIGHASYKPFGENPATANPQILKDLLRTELGFTGIAITDSMSMAAAKTGMKAGQNVYVRALRSGIDLLLMPGNAVQAKAAVGKALANGNLDVEERRLSIARVIAQRLAFERVASSLPASEPGAIQLKKAALDFQKIVLRNL